MNEYEYDIVCEVCEQETQVIIVDSEETPAHCPMCGEVLSDDWQED